MGLEGGTHGKAATKQRPGWADHSFRHFLKLIIHAGPSSLFFYPLICPCVFLGLSVSSVLPPTSLWLLCSFSPSLFCALHHLETRLSSHQPFFLFFSTSQFWNFAMSGVIFSSDLSKKCFTRFQASLPKYFLWKWWNWSELLRASARIQNMYLLNFGQAVFFVITPWHLRAPHQMSLWHAALLTRAAVMAGTNVPEPLAHHSHLYWIDDGREHAARQSGVGSSGGWRS